MTCTAETDAASPVARLSSAQFSSAHWDAAERLVYERLQGTGLAFLAGSLAVGLGNVSSDVDLYVVGTDLESEVVCRSGGVEIHVNPLSAAKVQELIELGSRYRVSGMDRSQLAVDAKTLTALVRLVTGQPVLITPGWADRLRRLDLDVVRRILIARNANIFSACAEDVSGALASDDVYTAVAASGLALEAACEAALAAAGDVYVGPKFLFRRLARTPATRPWCRHLWRLMNTAFGGAAEPHPAAVAEVVRQRLLAANLLLASSTVDGWDLLLPQLPPIPPQPGPGPRRSPYFTPMRFTDGWALLGPGDGYAVSEPTIRLWRRLAGRELPDLSLADRMTVAHLHRAGAVESDLPLPAPASGRQVCPAPRFACHPKQGPDEGEEL